MPREYGNYSFVVDSSFRPYSFSEMIQPLAIYKNAYDEVEAAYDDLNNKDIFKELSNLSEDNKKSKAIYDNYMSELTKQSEDLAKHGLSRGNRRALLNLKRRYNGEIGRLEVANNALKEILARRRNNNDTSMIYAEDVLNLDSFLDGQTPNLYGISGTELYTRGVAAGRAASSRVYSAGDEGSTLDGYYRKWAEINGYSKERMDAFRAKASAIPELQQAADDILKERGVLSNLTGVNLERARQSVLNGIIDGAIYQEKVNPIRDEGVMSKAQKASNALGWAEHNERVRQHDLQLKMAGYDDNGVYNVDNDQALKKAKAIAQARQGNGGSAYDVRNKKVIMVGATTGSIYRHTDDNGEGRPLGSLPSRALTEDEYTKLVDDKNNIANTYIRNIINNGRLSDYRISIIPAGATDLDGSGWVFDDNTTEDIYILEPRNSQRSASYNEGEGGTNDVPS